MSPKRPSKNALPSASGKKPRQPKASASAGTEGETPPFVRVWEIIQSVPRGKVVTYGQLSQMIDRRLTPVGVGWAIRAAPPESGLPWQRVVNGQGGISTDGEHPGLQRTILEKEGVRFERDGTIDLDRYGWLAKDDMPVASTRTKVTKTAKVVKIPKHAKKASASTRSKAAMRATNTTQQAETRRRKRG